MLGECLLPLRQLTCEWQLTANDVSHYLSLDVRSAIAKSGAVWIAKQRTCLSLSAAPSNYRFGTAYRLLSEEN